MPAQSPYSMKPRIRYAKAADGVNIAFWTHGEGAPLVYMTGGPWNHIELWQLPECQLWYDQIGRQRKLVRYDVRGTGMSERDVTDYSLETQLLDVEDLVVYGTFWAPPAGWLVFFMQQFTAVMIGIGFFLSAALAAPA